MATTKHIFKIGVIVSDGHRLLVVRKKDGRSFILPGGKPEAGENDLQTIAREIDEELGCAVEPRSVSYLATFTDTAADMVATEITLRVYSAKLIGEPEARSEIDTLAWFDAWRDSTDELAPSIRNQILPYLIKHKELENA
ncbi:MAG: NUDIX domain-containing protein [Hyphomonadaceae bacterium]